VKNVVADISAQLHDAEHTAANVGRAARLLQRAGLGEDAFVAALYEARGIARRRAGVTKRAASGAVNRMPYFFAVLEDRLGLRPRGVA